ncbi:N-carbamoylputrescine amidase [Pseudohalioglobus lutimaris]|uniref:N-carbamoylputrescine amidase n=1 Tax=Pseudohalioglobus lutimaris TaxID=1737061 RepID=A0A2N5X8Y6_9GAMM|nr:N-carbamoylputrescine amidase [Pseudohalioglobus lutimaris]PLW70918.1 N-carbamoylputrescine amidase [Pseudohalioglobus lutimaris]
MTRSVTFAATQLTTSWDLEDNQRKAEVAVREAHAAGAQVILLQELFATPYFCKTQQYHHLDLAAPLAGNPLVERFARLAAELQVVLPLSYYERDTNTFFNSLVMIDADGTVMDNYRKSHIPDGPGYCEKFYFTPGDTGFKVWKTRYGVFGAGICWDQWFPETARCCALMGAEAMLYPTAIGSEPQDPSLDSSAHWQRVMQGHAAANVIPVIASNRTGTEEDDGITTHFYGSSFITDHTGEKIAEAGREEEKILLASIDLDEAASYRRAWGLFRDRRPDLYAPIGHNACSADDG